MNTKYVAAIILGISMLSLSSRAADTSSNQVGTNTMAEAPVNHYMRHGRRFSKNNQKFVDQRIEFFKEFKKSEAELFDDIKDLDKTEAEGKVEAFYNEAFQNFPKRSNCGIDRVISSIEELKIPVETKALVIEKIKTTTNTQKNLIQQKAIDFAKSLLDLPQQEREKVISDYNKLVGCHIINIKRNGHCMENMRNGRNKKMQRHPHYQRMGLQCVIMNFYGQNGMPQQNTYMPHHMNRENHYNNKHLKRMHHNRFKSFEQERRPVDCPFATEGQPE